MSTHIIITSLVMSYAPDPDPLELLAVKQMDKTDKALYNEPLKIVSEKDQTHFILENGALMTRLEGTENYMVYYNDLWFKAQVEFKCLE